MGNLKTNRILATSGDTLGFIVDQKNCLTMHRTTGGDLTLHNQTNITGTLTLQVTGISFAHPSMLSAAKAPVSPSDLCNKAYVDARAGTVLADPPTTISAATNSTFPWNYTFPTNTLLIFGTSYHSMVSSNGSRLQAQFYNASGVAVGTGFSISGGNEDQGYDGGRGITILHGFMIGVPATATYVQFLRGGAGTGVMTVTINQTTLNSV